MKDITDLIEKFKNFINTDDEGKEWKEGRDDRKKLYLNLMSKDHIKSLTEEKFRNVIKSLWATNFWTNKDWKVDDTLKKNGGVERIREALSDLLYGSEPLHQRYDSFRAKVKGLGPSMLTELMAFTEPQKYCIWNEKPKAVLPFLEMDNSLPDRVFKYQISGENYEMCINVLSQIKKELGKVITDPDFIDVDFFLAFIFYKILPATEPLPVIEELLQPQEEKLLISPEIKIQDHATAQEALIELGNLLGFDTYIPAEDKGKVVSGIKLEEITTLKEIPQFTHPRLLETVKHIDVIWFREEFPVYCFEVEESTDVTKGLLRLYQIRQLEITPVIAGPENKRSKFEVEIEKDPFYNIKKNISLYLMNKSLNFWKFQSNFLN